ncbi:hypothetical protein [Ruminococcus sp.]|uniref:hypothetical protein n=1 Tax=Ruminococcus sp. TaxID=41978 RepID=UPI003864B6CC
MKRETIISQGQFKYFVVNLPQKFNDSENINFVLLLDFIGEQPIYEQYGKTNIGRAYSIIREKTNQKLRLTRRDLLLRTSKREVASIRRFFDPSIIHKQRHIKMPYKLEYIFSSIIDILNEIKKQPNASGKTINYPSALEQYVKHTYVEVFYETQRQAYKAAKKPVIPAAKEFDSDFRNPDSPLNKSFE